jgi:hypothetical protein
MALQFMLHCSTDSALQKADKKSETIRSVRCRGLPVFPPTVSPLSIDSFRFIPTLNLIITLSPDPWWILPRSGLLHHMPRGRTAHALGTNLMDKEFTQCLMSVGLGNPSPLNSCPRWPPQFCTSSYKGIGHDFVRFHQRMCPMACSLCQTQRRVCQCSKGTQYLCNLRHYLARDLHTPHAIGVVHVPINRIGDLVAGGWELRGKG